MELITWLQEQIATNQFFSAAIGGSAFYASLNYIKAIIFSLYYKIKKFFIRKITISSYNDRTLFLRVLTYFTKYIKFPENIQFQNISNDIVEDISDHDYLAQDSKSKFQLEKSLSYGRHWYVYNWYSIVYINIATEQHHGEKSDLIEISILSLRPRTIRDKISSSFTSFVGELTNKTKVYEYSPMYMGFNEVGVNTRASDSVFIDKNKRSIIETALSKLEKDKDLYKKAGVNRKLGVLLYGPPGTGKSSLILDLAKKYNRSVYYLDLSSKTIQDRNFARLRIPASAFVVIEDMDCYSAFKVREKDSQNKEDVESMPKILKMLDGLSLPDNVVFFATTNYIDKIDQAVKRYGRFDIQVELGLADRDIAEKMINHINPDKLYLLDQIQFPISQAELQAKILK